jgi:RecB family exonuclease
MSATFLFGVSAVLHFYIAARLVPALPAPWHAVAAGWLVSEALLVPLGMLAWRYIRGIWAERVAVAGLFAMGLFSSLLVATALRDVLLIVVGVVAATTPLAVMFSRIEAVSAVAVPLAALAVTVLGLWNARRIARVVHVDVPIEGLPPQLEGFTIAQISDVHVGPTIRRNYVEGIVAAVNALDADVVAITGDLVDGSVPQLREHVAPLAQLRARPDDALVLPGCDEKRLPAAPEPLGPWSEAQRSAWGLPTREALAAAQRAAWRSAMQLPAVDLLWRSSDEGGEPLLPSPLLQALQCDGLSAAGVDARCAREVCAAPTLRPAPSAASLPVRKLSASMYADLRACPYRFFALRQLGLQEVGELEAEIDKRDFGSWLHLVLQHFHERLRDASASDVAAPASDAAARTALLDAAAQAATAQLGLDAGGFLPFAATWPQVRDGYLRWLAEHEAQGAVFLQAELALEQPLHEWRLVGKLDRVDEVVESHEPPEGARIPFVIDYKTESAQTTRQRIADGAEDTQLAFYAALLGTERLRAAYVNVGERGETASYEQKDVLALRELLRAGIRSDLGRIAAGPPLPALGEGPVCDFCAARGLCRKDFWQ